MSDRAYTGRSRRKGTPWSVKASDLGARWIITIGGIATIVAVFFVFYELGREVAPLFFAASVSEERALNLPVLGDSPLHLEADEYRVAGWVLYEDGKLQVFDLHRGAPVETIDLISDDSLKITGLSTTVDSSDIALGLSDGSVILGSIRFETTFLEYSDVPPEIAELPLGEIAILENGVVQRTPQGQFRIQTLKHKLMSPVEVSSSPIVQLDHISPPEDALGAKEHTLATASQDGSLKFGVVAEKENLLTGAVEPDADLSLLPANELPANELGAPFRLLLSGRGDNVIAAWPGGDLIRFDVRNRGEYRQAEQLDVVPEPEAELTVCEFALGRETLMCGDSLGRLHGWFRVRTQGDVEGDGLKLKLIHPLESTDSAVRSVRASQRSRMISVGYENGTVRVFFVTTELPVIETVASPGESVVTALITPKDDGLMVATEENLWQADFDPAHPEATFASIFTPVWYEGYDKPMNLWQSSFATAAPEMKLGLMPLIFGTMKATFYTMLFGAPLALLAAIYTSEFMHTTLRACVKPIIEMMASLPSVVLGFLAALVFAPIVERHIPVTLASFLTIPLAFLLAAHLWQMLPEERLLRMQRYRWLFLLLVLPLGGLAAVWCGPIVEQVLFAGDTMRWLDGQIGSGTGGWVLLWLPLSAVICYALLVTLVNPWLRQHMGRWSRVQFALIAFGKVVAGVILTFALTFGISIGLNAAGLDPRGSFVDTFEQRNALVVGFVMGFAVIPIIYTLADDALNTVPRHLRSASLGCGATQWQTTIRIVVPTAMSGLFSALMIGLGRAVGETMIVLMAGGNTPVMKWNIFNGFRTLSANIAVELPEAVKQSTHYRTLFLAALTLLVLTFLINTVAEIVRLRFRKRAYQL